VFVKDFLQLSLVTMIVLAAPLRTSAPFGVLPVESRTILTGFFGF